MSVYDIVTEKILQSLSDGIVPWRKPWNVVQGPPQNYVTRRPYSGINLLLLSLDRSHRTPYYLTFKQAQALGGTVRKGEHGTLITFYTTLKPKPDPNKREGEVSSKERDGFVLRYYLVFNYDQCENLPAIDELPVATWTPSEHADAIVENMPDRPAIKRGGTVACYSPTNDTVTLPETDDFYNQTGYYETLFHELVHSTGHPTRLDRESVREKHEFGSKEYGREELVAEIGSGFLCALAGIENDISNLSAYCGNWIRKIKEDKQAIFWAASRAQKAADFITGKKGE